MIISEFIRDTACQSKPNCTTLQWFE